MLHPGRGAHATCGCMRNVQRASTFFGTKCPRFRACGGRNAMDLYQECEMPYWANQAGRTALGSSSKASSPRIRATAHAFMSNGAFGQLISVRMIFQFR